MDASVPTSLTDEEAERLGMIITHAYVQQNILPAGLAKSVFKYLLTNDVRDDTLLESFLLYADVRERQLIKIAISDSSLIKKHHHELSQLAQRRCDNVVTTSLLTLSQRCGTVKNVSCVDVGSRRCDNIPLRHYQDVATTLQQRHHNIKHWISRPFYYRLF